MNFVRYRQWPVQGEQYHNELRQAFDRFFRGELLDQPSTDDSAVVTSQWVPRVDVKEEKDRFVLYADLPGIDPDDIEVSMAPGTLGSVPGTVTRILRVGFEVRVFVSVEGGSDVLVTMTRTLARNTGVEEGARVWLTAAHGATTVPVMQAV